MQVDTAKELARHSQSEREACGVLAALLAEAQG